MSSEPNEPAALWQALQDHPHRACREKGQQIGYCVRCHCDCHEGEEDS